MKKAHHIYNIEAAEVKAGTGTGARWGGGPCAQHSVRWPSECGAAAPALAAVAATTPSAAQQCHHARHLTAAGLLAPAPAPLQQAHGKKFLFGREFEDEAGASPNWLFVAPTELTESKRAVVKVGPPARDCAHGQGGGQGAGQGAQKGVGVNAGVGSACSTLTW